ncbi:MAG: FecR domain-containing protein [Acidobacteria bacterium]|nr:FecR domain-containing protein [Acidobacteriota bacterium]
MIVDAAQQLAGFLYVQTKDVTVSVIGTVFLVNADEAGSRVAVIEGEVHVRQGETERPTPN